MTAHFPILQVVLPLLAAPLMILLRRGPVAWLIALVASAAALTPAAMSHARAPRRTSTISGAARSGRTTCRMGKCAVI